MNMHSNDYLRNQIATASREQLLLMFYDGAIRFTNQAKIAINNNDIDGRSYAINKASAIITELSATLDHNLGGKIAADLDSLYAYMLNELSLANTTSDVDRLEGVEKMLLDLRQTWQQAIVIYRQEKQAASFAAGSTPIKARGALSVAA